MNTWKAFFFSEEEQCHLWIGKYITANIVFQNELPISFIFETIQFEVLISRFGFSRITSDKSADMKHIVYTKIVDLDKSPCNQIVLENSELNDQQSFECPHHIIVGLIKIVGEMVRLQINDEEPEVLQKKTDTEKLLEIHHKEFMKELQEIKKEIECLKTNNFDS